jgi:hypothetical protein
MECFHKISDTEIRRQALQRLEKAAEDLPITVDELAAFFAADLQSFGTGEVPQASITQAVRWYVFRHKGKRRSQRQETPAGMVRCTDCLQDRCQWRQITSYGNVVMQSSPAYRWCSDYTAKIHWLEDYRGR